MTPAIVTFVLVLARVGSLVAVLPLFSMSGIPRWTAPLIALAVSALISANTAPVVVSVDDGLLPFLLLVGMECLLGTLFGLGVAATFGALALGAEIMSAQMGFSFATLFDPFTKATESLLGSLSSWLSGLMFMALGLDHRCLEIVARSFETIPPGTATPAASVGVLIAAVGGCLSLGVQLAGPIVAMVWLIQVFLALLSKLAPKMNAFFAVGTTVTGAAGLAMLVVSLPWLLAVHGAAMVGSVERLARQLGL